MAAVLLLTTAVSGGVLVAAAPAGSAGVPSLRAPAGLLSRIEALAPYVEQVAMQALVRYSGATMFPGMAGGPISAVQRAFNKPITGRYDLATVGAVNRFKRAHGLPANAIIEARTWRILLSVYKPKV
jgi:murein L,D-transpeptidase YcbB/YkuD